MPQARSNNDVSKSDGSIWSGCSPDFIGFQGTAKEVSTHHRQSLHPQELSDFRGQVAKGTRKRAEVRVLSVAIDDGVVDDVWRIIAQDVGRTVHLQLGHVRLANGQRRPVARRGKAWHAGEKPRESETSKAKPGIHSGLTGFCSNGSAKRCF